MEYENELELCEYNPISLQYEKEIKLLAQIIEAPTMSFFQKLMTLQVFKTGLIWRF